MLYRRARNKKKGVVYSHIHLPIHALTLQSLQVSQAYFLQFSRHLAESLLQTTVKSNIKEK